MGDAASGLGRLRMIADMNELGKLHAVLVLYRMTFCHTLLPGHTEPQNL
ncbi:MAG TPA: hypothetical protein VK558_09925 [Patescibacteria group bacterium]|nr:hypothetical protein [Patescibacteria group bacterium]